MNGLYLKLPVPTKMSALNNSPGSQNDIVGKTIPAIHFTFDDREVNTGSNKRGDR